MRGKSAGKSAAKGANGGAVKQSISQTMYKTFYPPTVLTTLLVTSLLGTVVIASLFASKAAAAALSFQEWKTARVEEAKSALDRLQMDLQIERIPSPTPTQQSASGIAGHNYPQENTAPIRQARTSRADQRLQQAQLNFEISQELGVSDYFALYLAQLTDRNALAEATKKFSPNEVLELALLYQKLAMNGPDSPPAVSAPVGAVPSRPTTEAPTPAPGKGSKPSP